jgi:hypothetical protein
MADNDRSREHNQIKRKSIPTISIVPDALKYLDENNEKFEKIRKKIKYIEKMPQNIDTTDETSHIDTDHIVYRFYDNDKNILFKSRIEYIGKYYIDQNIWIWAWALPNLNKSGSTIIRNVFMYGTDINVTRDDIPNPENLLLRTELITSRSIITDHIQIEMHCAIASYLAKKPMILPFYDLDANERRGQLYTYRDDKRLENPESDNIMSHFVYYMYILDPPVI